MTEPSSANTYAGRRTRSPRVAALQAAGVVVVAGVGLTLLHFVDPNEPGHYPSCPFLFATGFYCPGCGSMRCLHYLTVGDVSAALQMNLLTIVTLPYFVWVWVMWVRGNVFGRPQRTLAPAWVIWTVFAAIMIYWVVRNIPGFEFLAPDGQTAPALVRA